MAANPATSGAFLRQESARAPEPAKPAVARGRAERPDLLLIGVSTGGPNALAELVPALPADLPVPVLIVQHMPPLFTKALAERLDQRSRLKIMEATDGAVASAGEVWIAPGDYHMTVEARGGKFVLRLNQAAAENGCRPAVDVLFRSAASAVGGRALVVMLTGMGQDGLKGSEPLVAAGAQLLAQDEASSVVWGMPGAVTRAGLASKVLPLSQMAGEITRLLRR